MIAGFRVVEMADLEDTKTEEKFLSSKNTSLSALEILQRYGIVDSVVNWNIDYNLDSPIVPTCKPFIDLHLNSVEEEDKFLYGEHILNSDELTSLSKKYPTDHQTEIICHGKSEDSYGATTPLRKLNSSLRKNLSETESQDKLSEKCHLSPRASKCSSELDNSLHSEIKIDKSAISEKCHISPTASKCSSELDESLHSEIKINKSAIIAPILNMKHTANPDYTTEKRREHPYEDILTEQHPKYETSRDFSSLSKYHLLYRSSLPSHKFDHIRYASSYSRLKAPRSESSNRFYRKDSETYSKYSPYCKRWSQGSNYCYHGRSSEKSTDHSRYKDRRSRPQMLRSRSPGYYSFRNKRCAKEKKSKTLQKTGYKKENYDSADSFCSLSLGSSSPSSSNDSSAVKKSFSNYKHKKSPRLWSRSPSHYASRKKTYDEKKYNKSPKNIHYYRKKKINLIQLNLFVHFLLVVQVQADLIKAQLEKNILVLEENCINPNANILKNHVKRAQVAENIELIANITKNHGGKKSDYSQYKDRSSRPRSPVSQLAHNITLKFL